MERIALGDGRWFDIDKATEFEEARDWNGSNHISRATGSQWYHERLYKTAGGCWILQRWSNYENELTTYEILQDHEANRWLLRNDHFDKVDDETLAANEV